MTTTLIDERTVGAVKQVQEVGLTMRTRQGDVRPFLIPNRVAYEIVKALRGDRGRTASIPAGDISIPD